MTRALRWGLAALVILLLTAGAGALWARASLRGSLPQLEGTHPLPGLAQAVVVERDALGIPTVRGRSRQDVARATGFLHAQDRFFQMDLARRRAAGELSGLVGARALVADREIRIHRFRPQARRAVDLLQPADRSLLEAYTAGVNAGLAALAAPPFEYLLLRLDPAPWRPEDTLLVVLSMFVTLQDDDASYESTLATMNDVLPREVFEFLAPRGTEWDTPIVGEAFAMPPVPAADVYDLRAKRAGRPTVPRRSGRNEAGLGSNNFAVAASRSATGAALVANDMHLGIRVPNTWYRAFLEWPNPQDAGEPHRLIGTTLPGVPALVTGSNTWVAWGFTNTYADWGDIVLLETDPGNPERYRTPDGWREFDRFTETIEVAGQAPATQEVRWTMWGPLLPPDHRGRMRAFRWVAHSADRLAASLTPMESARTLEEAFDSANGLGTPGQNVVAADRSGRVGWTVYGSIPRRVGLDGQLPASWADGSRGWQGWLDDTGYPRVIDPPSGQIWTANARVVEGEALGLLGDGSYEVGSRARVIRDRLAAKDRFTAADLLDIQLDTRATFLERWKDLLVGVLSPAAVEGHPQRQALRALLTTRWTGQAAPDSAAYRFTRAFRDFTSERVFSFVLVEAYEADARFDYNTVRRREGPLWAIVNERPLHLLDPAYATWDAFLLDTVDLVIEAATRERDGPLADRAWSEANVTAYRHPLSAAVPFLGRWLDMPYTPLPGDLYTPRVASGAVGASERMVVSPGREAEGIMHMPTGQSGHPLSPFYANSHEAWVEGRPTPFLPGPARHTLTLVPGK